MRLLLDTQAFLWFSIDAPELSQRAKSLVEDPDNERFLSIASVWELGIKSSLGKLQLPGPLPAFINQQLIINMTSLLPIEIDDIAHVVKLPRHHRDPFDRLLIAQAVTRQLIVVSSDRQYDAYGVRREW